MKKLLSVLIFVLIFVGSAFAEGHRVGIISHINATEEEFKAFSEKLLASGQVRVFSTVQKEAPTFTFYDSLTAMLMALNSGEVDEIFLSEAVAAYIINTTNGKYFEACVLRTIPMSYSFGFRKNDAPELRNKFNEALMSMKADGSLQTLVAKYIYEAGVGEPEVVEFEKFENASTIKVAVTGDLPPIDYIKADGTPAGFNTAVLSEIAKRLKLNVELISIESGARSASLASGRSDVVFWFQVYDTDIGQPDVPDGIALSEPYFTFDEFIHIGLKK